MDITLHLPVRSYVFKYCRTLFGTPGQPFDCWRLSTCAKEGKFMYALLERSLDRYEKFKPGECTLNLQVPSKIVCTKGCHISQESIDFFNDYIKQVIMDEILLFYTGIHSKIGLKAIDKVTVNQYQADKKIRVLRIQPKEAQKFFWQKSIIYDILAKYDITEDEISYESVVKHLQRNCNFKLSA